MTQREQAALVRPAPPLVLPPGRWDLRPASDTDSGQGAVVRLGRTGHECWIDVPRVTIGLECDSGGLVLRVVLPLSDVVCSAPGHPFRDRHPLPIGAPDLVLVAPRCVLTATHLVAPAVATAGSMARTVELSGPLHREHDGSLHVALSAAVREGPLAPRGVLALIVVHGVLEPVT